LTGEPTPIDFDGDVLDFAVGNDHMLALSTDHRLFVVGDGGNGQLGLEDRARAEEWKEVVLALKKNQRAVSVYAGYKTSFVMVSDDT
jgi:alpha-tubulin suppressor-like RCC1 family protein